MAIALPLSPWAIQAIDKLRRAFIWTGGDSVAGGKCKAAWEIVCRPRELGGLGVTDLRWAGIALRVRWLWLRRTDGDRTWSTLRDDFERSVVAVFQAATASALGDGASTMFWTDSWLDGTSIRTCAPAVFAAVPRRHRATTVADALHERAWARQVTGPRTMRLIVQFLELWERLELVVLTPGVPDTFVWRLNSDGAYSSASAYGAMFSGSTVPIGAAQIWKTAAPPRVRFFFWLVLHDHCWNASRRHRHGLQDNATCIMCQQMDESMAHILLGCVVTREVWARCLRWLLLDGFVQVHETNPMTWWIDARKRIPKPLRRGFDSVFMLIGWIMWKERNARTFDRQSATTLQLMITIKEEAHRWILAGNKHLATLVHRREPLVPGPGSSTTSLQILPE
jgi:hypothetical protein